MGNKRNCISRKPRLWLTRYNCFILLVMNLVTDVSLYDLTILLSLGAAQVSIQSIPIVFTQWFNTSTIGYNRLSRSALTVVL